MLLAACLRDISPPDDGEPASAGSGEGGGRRA